METAEAELKEDRDQSADKSVWHFNSKLVGISLQYQYMIETIAAIVAFSVFDAFLFWLSAKPERMNWMKQPSNPAIQRLVTRGSAWVILVFIGLMLISLVLQLV